MQFTAANNECITSSICLRGKVISYFHNSSFGGFLLALKVSNIQNAEGFLSTSRVLFTKAEKDETQFPRNTSAFVRIARSMMGSSSLSPGL